MADQQKADAYIEYILDFLSFSSAVIFLNMC